MLSGKWLPVILLLSSVLFFTSCGDDNPLVPGTTEFEVLQSNLDTYVGGSAAPVITAQTLFDNINDGNTANDYYVLSVRNATHYAIGHIPGAANIYWKDIGDNTKLSILPNNKPILVYCYTGHTGGIATTALNAMGYDAVNLKFGIMAWTQDAAVRVAQPFVEGVDSHNFATETTVNATGTYDLADPDYATSDAEDDILLAAIDAYAGGTKAATTTAQTLFDNINDGNTSNNPVILSVRSATDYAIGHIPGAINIPWRDVTETDNLKKLPTDKQIVVYCYTGHTAGVATTALNMLGYDAVNLKFGIMAWTQNATVRASTPFSEAGAAHQFATEP